MRFPTILCYHKKDFIRYKILLMHKKYMYETFALQQPLHATKRSSASADRPRDALTYICQNVVNCGNKLYNKSTTNRGTGVRA